MKITLAVVLASCTAFFGVRATLAGGDAEVRTFVEKVLRAGGGEAVLARYPASTIKGHATFSNADGKVQATVQYFAQGMAQTRAVVHIEKDGQKSREVTVLNGDKAWRKIDDKATEDLDKDALREEQDGAYAAWLANLTPLKDKNVQLKLLGESTVEKRPVLGLEVKRAGRPTVKLFFDKENSLLLKMERRAKPAEAGKEVAEELFFSDYKEIQGTQQPMTIQTREDGKVTEEFRCTELKLLDKLDDKLFQKP